MKIKHKILSSLKFIFPSQANEWFVFICFFFIYGVLGIYVSQNFTIIFNQYVPWDAYFSFDNRAIVMNGGGVERHPLAKYWFDAIRNIAFLYSDNKFDSNFRWALALFSNIVISLSIVQIFKYLLHIIHLPLNLSLIIIAFYGVFFTNIILSFTPETYTYTLLFLTIFNYFTASRIQRNEKIPFVPLAISGIFIGGLTITNLSKVFIPVFFEKNIFTKKKSFLNALLRGFSVIAVFILIFLNRVNFDYSLIINKTGEQYEKFTKLKNVPVWDMISSWFFGGNILISNLYTLDYKSKVGFSYKAIFMDVYSSWCLYFVTFSILFLVTWCYIKNFRNKLVQIIFISFLIDIIIHCVLRFGLNVSYIYGGHFVFVYPIFIGWLLRSYKSKPKILTSIIVSLITITFFIFLNNFYRLNELYFLLHKYYS